MQAKERLSDAKDRELPLLMVDIDGVVSLFGGWEHGGADAHGGARARAGAGHQDGSFHSIDGMPHFLSSTAAAHLLDLASMFELVWASGWEERANEHLPHLLGLPRDLPFLRFPRVMRSPPTPTTRANAHWKLDAIDAFAGGRALAWVDDALNDACHEWALARAAPTLLVQTDPARGLTASEATLLADWARALPIVPAE